MDDQVSEEGIISVSLEKASFKKFMKDHFNWPFTRIEFLSMIIIQLLGVCNCIIFNSYLDLPLVKSDSKRYPILKTLSILSPILGCYGLVTMKLSQGIYLNLITLSILIISPIIILLVLILRNLYLDYLEVTVACIFIPGSIIGLNILKMIRKNVQESIGITIGDILVIILIVCCNLLFNMLIFVLFTIGDVFSGPKIFIEYTAAAWLIVFTVIWIMIHSLVFKKQPNEIQALRSEILNSRNHSMKVQVILTDYPDVLSVRDEGYFLRNGHSLASLGILISFLSVELWLITIIYEIDTGKYSDSAVYLAMFYTIAIPLFLYIGILFSSSQIITQDKYLIILLFVALVPSFFVEWLSYYLYSSESTYYLGIVLGIGFPGSLVYWLTMAMIFQYNKRTFQYFSSIFCLIFLIPVGLILPLYKAGGMNKLSFWITEVFLLLFGISLLTLWLFQLFIKITKQVCLLIQEMSRFHSEDLSLYLYSISFLFGFSLIAWMTLKRIKSKNDWTAGLLFGSFLILGLMILSSIYTHRVDLYKKDGENVDENINEIILGSSKELTEIQSLNHSEKKKNQLILLSISIFIILSISIPLFVKTPFKFSQSSGIIFITGGFFSLLLFLIIIELKHFLKRFGQTVISFLLGYCWLFCFIPLLVLIPVSLGSASTETEQRKVASWCIGIILLLFMIGVSILSITLNLLLNKLEYEKIAKFCCLHVQEMLDENGVKSSLTNLRDIYDNFYNTSAEAVEKVLLAQTVYSFRKLEEHEDDKEHSVELLSIKELSKIKNKNPENEKVKSKKGIKLSEFCKKLCKKKERQHTIFKIANFSPEELGDIDIEPNDPEEPENNECHDLIDDNWHEKFKQDAVKAQEVTEMHIISEKTKAEFEIVHDNKIKLDDIPALKLTKEKKIELQRCKELELIIKNLSVRAKWTKAVFAKFSNGLISKDGEPWMNLSDLRNFVRLVGLKSIINQATVDLLFVSITRIYTSGTNSISHVKINYETFLNKIIPELLKLVNMKLKEIQTEEDLIKEQIFPYLINNLPYFRVIIQKFIDQEISKDFYEEKKEKEDETCVKNFEVVENKEIIEKMNISSRPKHNSLRSNSIKRLSLYKPIKKKTFCSLCLDKFSSCTSRFFSVMISCVGKIFNSCLLALKSTPQYTSVKQDANQNLHNKERRESPSWEDLSKLITSKLEEINKEARKNEAKKPVLLSLNPTNIIGVLNHIMEIYSFSSISFFKEVGWKYENPLTKASEIIMALNNYWLETYWICFICSMIFICLLIPALKLIKQNRLGLEADFTVAKFPSPNFFLSKLIGILGNSIYMTVMCTILSSFACIYEGDSWYLIRNPKIECFSSDHFPYFFISIFSLFIYYPAATLILPSIAYQDKVLDIKYDTTYLVLESQGKVFLAAVAVFFDKEKYIWLLLIVSIFVSLFLFFTCLKMKPCLVKSYNLWKTGGFLVPIWASSCALINLYSQNTLFTFILLVSGIGVILIVLIYMYVKFYGCRKKLKSKTETKILKKEDSVMKLDKVQRFPNFQNTVIPGVYDDYHHPIKVD